MLIGFSLVQLAQGADMAPTGHRVQRRRRHPARLARWTGWSGPTGRPNVPAAGTAGRRGGRRCRLRAGLGHPVDRNREVQWRLPRRRCGSGARRSLPAAARPAGQRLLRVLRAERCCLSSQGNAPVECTAALNGGAALLRGFVARALASFAKRQVHGSPVDGH